MKMQMLKGLVTMSIALLATYGAVFGALALYKVLASGDFSVVLYLVLIIIAWALLIKHSVNIAEAAIRLVKSKSDNRAANDEAFDKPDDASTRDKLMRLEAIRNVATYHSRGIHKRIDENRELLELLQEKAPELLSQCYWIESWIECNDGFLVELEKHLGVEKKAQSGYPRPWPGKRERVPAAQ